MCINIEELKEIMATILALGDPPPKRKSHADPLPGHVEFARVPRPTIDQQILLPVNVGPKTDETDTHMIIENANNIALFPKCAVRPLAEWQQELLMEFPPFLMERPMFIADVGYRLMTLREDAGLTRTAVSRQSGYSDDPKGRLLSRVTINEIESGDVDGGSTLAKVSQYLHGCSTALRSFGGDSDADCHIDFTITREGEPDIVPRRLRASDDVALFTARLVRDLRRAAGLTQIQLNDRLRLPAALEAKNFDLAVFKKRSSTGASRLSLIESMDKDPGNKRSIRLGTLFSIAYFCGFKLSVQIPNQGYTS